MTTITIRIARTGEVVAGSAPAAGFVPWPGAPVTFQRLDAAYPPGRVVPRNQVSARTNGKGEASVRLEPGTYAITLPSLESFERVLPADVETLDLAEWLATGIGPGAPQFETLAPHVGEAPPSAAPWPAWWIRPGAPAVLHYHAGSGEYLPIGGTAPAPDPDPDPTTALIPGPGLFPGEDLFPSDGEAVGAALFPDGSTYPDGSLYPYGGD